jgi:hypothetical protein
MHLVSMLRMCGAPSVNLPVPITNIFVGSQQLPPMAEGGLDGHNLLGALIPLSGSNVFLGATKLPAIAAIKDMAAPDVMGIVPHVQGLPIPVQGENTVRIGSGNAAAGLGMMQQLGLGSFGPLSIGELVSVAGQVIGTVQNFTQIGGGGAVAQLNNLQGSPISPGTTVVGQTSGYSFTFSNYFDTRVMTGEYSYPAVGSISNAIVTDSGDYIVIQDYYDYSPTMNLTAAVITT